jgi:hypothetical protein
MTQSTLFTMSDLIKKTPPTIQQRFELYHRRHPEVWELFVQFAEAAKRAGRRHYSSRAILHRIRWEREVDQRADESFKISNLWSSRYARLLISTDPDRWDGFFDLREIKE